MADLIDLITPTTARDALRALAGGPVKAGPVPGTLVPPQLWDGSDELFPDGVAGRGRAYAASTVVNSEFSYLELWYADNEQVLDAPMLVEFKSGEPVDWTRSLAELAVLAAAVGTEVYAIMRYQYRTPVVDLAACDTLDGTATLGRVGSWDVRNEKGGASFGTGRLFRQKWSDAGATPIFVDHWLLQPGYSPPYLDVKMRLRPRLGETLRQFFSAPPGPTADWRYAQIAYTRDSAAPAASSLVP